ncbi:MAG TPA: lipoyl domain-containing protein [Steroidobacteraceae bacterium]
MIEVLLPKLGFAMTEGVLAEWLVSDGRPVIQGEPLFSLESDKSVNEIESPATGTLRILKASGETYQVGEVLAEIH